MIFVGTDIVPISKIDKMIQEKGDQEMWMKQVEDLYYSLLNKKGK